MRKYAQEYGECFTLRWLNTPPIAFFSDPVAIKQIFTASPERALAGRGNVVLKPILGENSALLLDGARHKRERKLLMPPFHGERMRLYGEIMREAADRSIDNWPVEQPFPIHERMQAITLDIILRTVFGVDEGALLQKLRSLLIEFLRLVGSSPLLLIRWLQVNLGPLTSWQRISHLGHEIDAVLYEQITQRKAAAQNGRTDIMAMLIEARDEDGQPMSDQELRDEMITMLLAGHETTATSLSWVVHRLLQTPDVLEKFAPNSSAWSEGVPYEPSIFLSLRISMRPSKRRPDSIPLSRSWFAISNSPPRSERMKYLRTVWPHRVFTSPTDGRNCGPSPKRLTLTGLLENASIPTLFSPLAEESATVWVQPLPPMR